MSMLILLCATDAARGDLCQAPDVPIWYFARIILDQDSDLATKAATMESACRSINPDTVAGSTLNALELETLLERGFVNSWIKIPDAFRKLGGNPLEDDFVEALKKIKNEPSAVKRVQAVYELVLVYKKPYGGAYAKALKGGAQSPPRPLFMTPQETLKDGGVCRDVARLLHWALMQVARSSSTSREAETFVSEYRTSTAKVGDGHAWVSVNLPIRDTSGRIVEHQRIDLDATNWTEGFVPHMPFAQRQPVQRMKQNFEKCQSIVACLKDQAAAAEPVSPKANGSQATP